MLVSPWFRRTCAVGYSSHTLPPPPHQVWSSRAAGLLFTQYFWFHQCFLLEGAQLRSLKVRLGLSTGRVGRVLQGARGGDPNCASCSRGRS